MTLSGEQRRQLIDTQQAYDAWRAAKADSNRRFAGSMRWGERNGKEYLLRKIGKTERSLGFRSKETEAAYEGSCAAAAKTATDWPASPNGSTSLRLRTLRWPNRSAGVRSAQSLGVGS